MTIGRLIPTVGDLGMPAPPLDDADPVGQLVHDLARSDLDAEFVEPGFASEPLDEQIETFLPRRFAEVVRAGHLDRLGDEAVTIETVLAHGGSRSVRRARSDAAPVRGTYCCALSTPARTSISR